ncbi:unnamed protein product [Xylocopa violacea]|uniref:Uncharacterized protein n=1 Tax=Xylocopa violacea TaxID=135666 RepID=A0ABP1N5X7_XYLVO
MRTLGRLTIVWTVLLFYGFLPWNSGKFSPEDFEEKLVALYKVIDYIRQRPGQMNADVTFSVTIVEANVAATLLHENVRYVGNQYRRALMFILKLSDLTRRCLLYKVTPESEDVELLHKTLNYPVLWMKKVSWRRGALKEGRINPNLTYRDVHKLVMQGTPKEEESDRCLAEIVRNKLNADNKILDLCLDVLTSQGPSRVRGYPLTHRLLLIQIAKAMKCDKGLASTELTLSYCSAILQDLIDVETAGFPYQTPDLMLEQVVLCGMEGFLEFTGKHYERLVLSWSHPSGCFSSFGNTFHKNRTARVSRRASSQTDFGCDSHATGLAAAALSLFIRENLENIETSEE